MISYDTYGCVISTTDQAHEPLPLPSCSYLHGALRNGILPTQGTALKTLPSSSRRWRTVCAVFLFLWCASFLRCYLPLRLFHCNTASRHPPAAATAPTADKAVLHRRAQYPSWFLCSGCILQMTHVQLCHEAGLLVQCTHAAPPLGSCWQQPPPRRDVQLQCNAGAEYVRNFTSMLPPVLGVGGAGIKTPCP